MAIRFETFSGVREIDAGIWNGMAMDASPMMEWEYLYALEKSGSVSPERGYQPCHLVAYVEDKPIAIAPLYQRDRAWVEFGDGGLIEFLTELTGLPFHSGLVGTVPFTPVPGYQFLHHPQVDALKTSKMLMDYIDQRCENQGLSTSRIYFVSQTTPHLHDLLKEQGYLALKSQYCLWFNRDYQSFEDYVNSFKSSRRTKIRRELRSIREQGISIDMVDGTQVPQTYFDQVFELYARTWVKHMGPHIRPFLNGDFFQLLAEKFRHRTSFSVSRRSAENVGMALFYHKAKNIYGRYWGCFQEVPFLHFSTCYYYPIEYAIRHGIHMMDPGFGGEHKMFRGFEEVPVYHYIKFYGEQKRRIANMVLKRMGFHPPKP